MKHYNYKQILKKEFKWYIELLKKFENEKDKEYN